MASASRTFARALRTSARPAFAAAPRVAFRHGGRRFYSSEPETAKKGSNAWLWAVGGAGLLGGGYYFYTQGASSDATPKVFASKYEDYQKVYNEIASRLEEKDDYDDGSYGPVLVRLAWHASGTYDKETGTGGSNGATMRFAPEADHGANAGLVAARDFLEPVKGKWNLSKLGFGMSSLLTLANSQVPLDFLLRPLDPRRCCRDPGDAGSQDPVPPWPLGQGPDRLHT
jgi:cytochrome c peroxidase